MTNAGDLSLVARAQRAQGTLDLVFGPAPNGEPARLKTLLQSGCLRARLPRPQNPGWREVVTLNISGGIAGGDSLATSIHLEAGARVLVAGQAAERVYRAVAGEPAQVRTIITVDAGAHLAYLPQETIFYDGFALERHLVINLAADACYLGVEMQAFGRHAMGETLRAGWWRDAIRLHREGRLILHDRVRLQGAIDEHLQHPAVAHGAKAVATLIMAGPEASAHLAVLRELWHDSAIVAGATMVENVLVARLLAHSLHDLRRGVAAAVLLLRPARALPRVWQS